MEQNSKKPILTTAILFLLLLISCIILTSTLWLQQKFGNTTIDTIIFHYQNSLVGTPQKYYISYSKRLLLSLLISALLTGVAYFFVIRKGTIPRIKKLSSLGVVVLLGSISYATVQLDIIPYLTGNIKKNTFIEENYVVADSTIVFPENKRNVIIIVMESMERTFSDPTIFEKPLTPFLRQLTEENPSCKLRVEKNLAWTTAGLTGLFFGVPLYVPINNSYLPEDGSFLPASQSILSLFEENGYDITYIAGSDLKFAAISNLFTTHAKNGTIYEKQHFLDRGGKAPWRWGVRDKDLYAMSKSIITEIASGEKPFLLVFQTIDTHNTAEAFGDYPEPYDDDRDAFVAADYMIAEFLAWLEKQPFYENTSILIVGDHQYMNNTLGTVTLTDKDRTIYNVFLNTGLPKGNPVANREAIMVDMGPSLLEVIGVKSPQNAFALGRSIFSTPLTLVEQYGRKQLTENLNGQSDFYNALFFKEKTYTASQ